MRAKVIAAGFDRRTGALGVPFGAMGRFVVAPAVPADAAGVAEVVAALELSLYPRAATSFSREDLEDEWSSIDRTNERAV